MKKLKLFFALFAMLALGVGNAWGAEELYKTALFGSSYNSKKVSSYTDTWTATNNGFTVTVVNANNNNNGWAYIKMGRKNNASVGSITTSDAIDLPVTKVVLTIDAITVAKINSIKLKTSTDGSTYSDAGTFTAATGAQTVELTPTANLYYQIVVDCASGSKNGLIQISKVEYYADASAADSQVTQKPTLTTPGQFETENFTVEITAEEGAAIYYTLDGTDPTETSTAYTAAFTINATTTVKAIAVKDGVSSSVASATYTKVNIITGKTCAEAAALCTTTETTDKYQVEGYVTSIVSAYDASFGNITFWMADTKDGGNVLQGFRVKPTVDADKTVKVGDKVQVTGKLKKYNSTPEFNTGVYTITEVAPVYNVTIVSEHGTVTADPMSGIEGTEVTLTVEPDSRWVFDSWTVKDASNNDVTVTDNKFNIPASNVTVTANYTASEAPDSKLNLSANGVVTSNTYKVGETVDLPETITNDCSKVFVGWSADANRATEPEYAPGAEFALTETEHTLYAVYAAQAASDELTITPSACTTTEPYTFTINDEADGYTLVAKKNGGSTAPTYNTSNKDARTYAKNIITITAPKAMSTIVFNLSTQGKKRLAPITASVGTIAAQASGDATVTWTGDATEVSFTIGEKADFGSEGSSKAGQLCFSSITVTTVGALSNYSTTCSAAPKAEVNPAEVTATATGGNGTVSVTYENVNTESVAVALYNDEACTEAFTTGWLTASLDGDKNVTYTVAENTTYAERKAYIQLTAPETTGATEPAKVVIPVTQAGKDKVFASLAELVAADLTAGDEVTVTLNNDMIKSFYTITAGRAGVVFDVQKDGKDIKIFFNNQTTIVDWEVGGKLSGTLTNVKWTTYSNAWQLAPANTWAWANLTYTAPATIASIAVSGTPTKTTYTDGEAFDPAGLVATATYTDDTQEDVTNLVSWTFDPATLTKGQTSVNVVVLLNSVSSPAYEVTGLTVNDIPTMTVAEFIAARGTRCYLEGIVSGLTEGNSMKYGNFDLTDATGKIYVYGCLNGAGESQKFAELGVKNGDKIKVIADELTVYNSKDQAKNVQYVSHISVATIAIEDITMEVGETTTIAATVTPEGATVTYSIKDGDEYISLNVAEITANAVGTATITATVAEGATYLGNSVDFTVTVKPQNIAELPFEFTGGKADIENTLGMSQEGLGSDYTTAGVTTKLKFDGTGDGVIIHFNGQAKKLAYEIKGNGFSGGKFTVQQSADGSAYTDVVTYTELGNAATKEHELAAESRYVKFIYTEKSSGNVGLGNIKITKLSVLRDNLYDGKWGTLCPDQKVTYMQGASFYTLTYLEMKDGMPYKLFFDEITTDYLEAGKPYLFIAEGEEIKGVKSGDVVSAASNYNGFYGNVSGNTITIETTQTGYVANGDVVNYYGIINSRFTLLGNRTTAAHERAYVQIKNGQLDCLNPPASLPALAPGARRVVAGANEQNTTTGMENVDASAQPVKTIIDGQLYILRGEKMYDAQGKLVK